MITQLFFAGFLAGRSRKKPFLLVGIYLRVVALTGMGYQCFRDIFTPTNVDFIALADYGWLEDLDDRDHLLLHIKEIPHDY